MPRTLKQMPEIVEGDTDVVSIDYTDYLDTGEALTGTVTLLEVGTSDLTFANNAVSTASLTILGRTVAIGDAVQFKVTGQKAGKTYRVRITVSTNSTPARTCVREILLKCV